MKLSSANNRWDIHTLLVQDRMPCNYFLSMALLIREEWPSIHKRNRYRKRGSPCFIPYDVVMYHFNSPLMSTKYVVVCTVSMAKCTHRSSNPTFNMIFHRKTHSTQSYALLMSSLIAICPFFPILLFLILCKTSKATIVLSVIN